VSVYIYVNVIVSLCLVAVFFSGSFCFFSLFFKLLDSFNDMFNK
jgi:hypothetical protein